MVIGAGLAGVTAAYRLARAGVPSQLYEARDRVGGRCWTSRGWVDGQIAEHGGEFIDSRHVHLRALVKDLGLQLDDLWSGSAAGTNYPRFVDGRELTVDETKPQMERIDAAVHRMAREIGVFQDGEASMSALSYGTATPAAEAVDRLSMSAWLERNVDGIVGTRVGDWLDEVMCGWYGLNMDDLSALNWIDYFVIPAPGADERWHVRGGNDQVTSLASEAMPADTVHLGSALTSLRRRSDGPYELRFAGKADPVVADLVILTLPFTALRRVDLTQAGFSPQKMSAIDGLSMGYDVKLLVQYDRRPSTFEDWSGGLEYTDPDFVTWESSAAQPGEAGLITVYAGGRTGASWTADRPHGTAPQELTSQILDRIDRAVPGTASHFNGMAYADLWTHDPWVNGAYAAFGVGQYTRFWGGTAQAEGNVHFAGEATSTYSQGYLNGGVESGERAAIEVMTALGVPVPTAMASRPH